MEEEFDNEDTILIKFFNQNENFLREILNSSKNNIFFQNLSKNQNYANASWKKNFGNNTKNIDTFLDRIHPKYRTIIERNLKSLLGNKKGIVDKPTTIECQIKNLEKKYLYFDLTARTFKADNQKFLSILCIDTTQRKHEENELFKKNQTLNELLEHTPDIITRYDKNLRYTYGNKTIERTYGTSPESIIGKTNEEVGVPKEIALIWNNTAKDVFDTGKSKSIEFLYNRYAGNERWYQMQMVPEFDKNGSVDTVMTIARDITKHKLFEKNLAESEERYRKIFEHTSNGICIYRLEDNGSKISLIDINRSAERIENEIKESIIGKNITEIFPRIKNTNLIENLIKVWKTGIPRNFTVKIYEKNNVLLKWEEHYSYRLPNGEVVDVFTDQTQRKLTEISLKETYERYETLSEQNLMAIVITQDSRIKYLNSAAANLVGYTREEILNWGYGEYKKLIHPNDLEYVLVKDVLAAEKHKNGENLNFTYKLVDKQGNIKWVEQYSREIQYNNKVADFITLIDITERKRYETALSESEEKLRHLIESAEDIIEMLDKDGKYLYYHEPGHKRPYEKDYIGKTPFDVFEKEKADEIIDNLKTVIERGKGLTVENFFTFGSSKKWYSTRISPMYDEEGSIKGVVKIWRDITAQKKAELALKESEEIFRMFAEETIYGLLIIQNHSIKYLNRGAEKIFGYKLNEFKNWSQQDYNNLVHPKDIGNALDYLYNKNSGLEDTFEHFSNRIITKSGKMVWIEIYSKKILYEGQSAILITMLDITNRKNAEDHLKKSLAENKTLLKEIHHRVKNNLQIIASLLRTQSRKIKDPDDMQLIKNSINQINSMSLIHKNLYQSENLANVNLRDYIKSISGELYKSYGVNPDLVELDIDLEPILLNIDYAIPCGLIIGELMSNSLKYAFPDGKKGKIRISLKTTDNQMIELTVGDNGIGVPDYFNIDKLETTGFQLVKNLTEFQLNGKLIIEKNPKLKIRIIFKPE